MLQHNNGFTLAMTGASKVDIERENQRLKARIAELERLSTVDALTPLFNRRYFTEELDRWCWRAHRYGGTYGLLFLDIDRLKLINDTHGHAAGDAVIIAVAEALVAATRKSDIVARMGGDEYAVLLDSISAEKLDDKAQAMRKALTQLPVCTTGPVLKVDVSVGCCLIESGTRAADALETADRAMYADKRSKYVG